MQFEWLAAILAPRDMLPHPNFSTPATIKPANYFSALVYAQLQSLPSDPRENVDYAARFSGLENELINYSSRALRLGTSLLGGQELSAFARRVANDDRSMAVAAALVACLALSELDENDACFELLNDMLPSSSHAPSDSADWLLETILRCQLLMRSVQAGAGRGGQVEGAEGLSNLLDRVVVEHLPAFEVGEGVAWNYRETYRRIIAELSWVISHHRAGETIDLDEWTAGLLRGPVPSLVSEAVAREGDGYEAFVHERFENAMLSRDTTWRNEDVVDAPVWRSLVHFEVTSNPGYALATRRTLGELRLLRAVEASAPEVIGDALQLLRHSANPKSYRRALEYVRANGPLAALQAEGELVIEKRLLQGYYLSESDLRCVSASGQLLDHATASKAFGRLLDDRNSRMPRSFRGYQHPGVRLELVLDAALVLASVSDQSGDLALYLLTQLPGEDDALVERALVTTIARIDWSKVEGEARSGWLRWLERHREEPGDLVRAVASALKLDLAEASRPLANITAVAAAVDAVLLDGAVLSGEAAEQALEITVGALERVRQQASAGMFEGGGISDADVAVGLAIHANVLEIWPAVIDLLLDPAVSRVDKAPALRRMAMNPSRVPSEARFKLSAGMPVLIHQGGGDSFFSNSSMDPFPEALAAAAALESLPDDELMLNFCRLTGSQKAAERIEGARWLLVVARQPEGLLPSWVTALALQSSLDVDANVRAYAGRALGSLVTKSTDSTRGVLIERIILLLDQDGIIAPLLVLKALSEDDVYVPEPLLPKIAEIADSHPAFGVRLQARVVLDRVENEQP